MLKDKIDVLRVVSYYFITFLHNKNIHYISIITENVC